MKVTPSPTAARCVVPDTVRAEGTALAAPDALGLGVGEAEGPSVAAVGVAWWPTALPVEVGDRAGVAPEDGDGGADGPGEPGDADPELVGRGASRVPGRAAAGRWWCGGLASGAGAPITVWASCCTGSGRWPV